MMTIPENWILFINIGVIVFYILFCISGAKKGFLLQIVCLAATIAAFYASYRFAPVLADYFSIWPKAWTPMQDSIIAENVYMYINELCWFILVFLILKLLFKLLEPIAKGLQKVPLIKQVSKALGGILGLGIATVWILIISILLYTPLFANGSAIRNKSYIGIISDKTVETVSFLSNPYLNSQEFSDLVNNIQEDDGKDREAIRNWLEEHGYQTIEETDEVSGK